MSFSSLIYQVKSETKKVRIVNEGFCCISCKWIHDKGCGCVMNSQNQVNIEPNEFDLEADTFTDCEITVTPSSYADIYETFVLSVNNGFFAKTLSITGKVTEPHIKVSRSFFDFGAMVKRGSFANAIFHVENNCDAQLLWRVQEYKYNLEMGYFVEVYPKSISADCGCLCHNGSGTELEYVLDTSRPRRFVSLLVFYTIFNSRAYESSHVILVANILQPLVCIVNENNNKNIFDINEEFFVHETITRNFFIHNDSPLEVNYKWGEVEGSHASFISISFTTWDGKLYSWSRCCVQITITFHQPVYLQDVYIPCIIEALPEPVCFNICCLVKPPQIIISLPARKNGGYEDILWPSYETLRYNEHSITGEDIVEKNMVEEFVPIQIINVLPESDKSQWYPDDIITYLENIELEMCGERFVEIQRPSTVTTAKSSETSSQISFRSYLASVFTSSTNLYTYYIYFENITCRQLHKKMFEVTNIMDLSLKFAISIKNFKIRSLHRKRLDKILINMNLLFDDTYSQQLSEYGVFVIINPELGELKNKTTLSIEIQVYAETFGLYLEEIAIEVDNLPVFYLNLFIQVTGLPIEFPAEDNSQKVQDISLRYGSFSVCSKPEKRCVLIRNNCTIPYKIVWHVFIKNIEDYLKGPLNVIYDIFGFEQSPIEFKLRFLNYIGKESGIHYKLFEIAPQELYIKPKEEKSVQITLNPQYFGDMNNNLNFNIEAILIGHIYLEKQYQIIKNEASFVIRNPEKQLNPIKVNINAQIKSAHLDIKSLSGSRAIEVAVSEYLKLQKNVTINMRLLYHNSANFNISIGVNTVKPFDIISIQSANSESTIPDANNMLTCVISPKNCAEIWVQCKVDNEMLLQIADVLYKNIPHFLEDTAISKDNKVKITKPLNIYHNCDAKQEIPLSVILVFPLTFVPIEFLDFGQVTVDTEKLLTVKIQNKTESKTWFQISFEHGNVFSVCPERGYLLPNKPAEHFTYLVVIFKPNDVGDFEDNLKIVTCLTHYEQEIKLCGIGTFNEKHIHKLKLKM